MNESHPRGVQPIQYLSIGIGDPEIIKGNVVDEVLSCISINGQETVKLMCSPSLLPELAMGFLYNEGLVNKLDDITVLHVSDNNCVDIWINDFQPPNTKIVTSGCGGGTTFEDFSNKHTPLAEMTAADPGTLAILMRQMHLGAALYRISRGIHTAALAHQGEILLQTEDVGRHNAVDKLAGLALTKGVPTQGKILFTSGRVSSDMLNKARTMKTPIICSRTSPTSLSVRLAEEWNLTIVAYLRQGRMRVYSHPWRIASREE